MLQLHLLMTLAHAAASTVVVAAAIVVAAAFVATDVVVAMYVDDLVGFATSSDVDVDAINHDVAASGVFLCYC
jgi:hypothetical protein